MRQLEISEEAFATSFGGWGPLQTCRRENIGYLADVVFGVCVILSTTPRRKGRGSLDRRVRGTRLLDGARVFTQKELLALPLPIRRWLPGPRSVVLELPGKVNKFALGSNDLLHSNLHSYSIEN